MRTPEVYRYRGDSGFDELIKPIRTAFFSLPNMRSLKQQMDKLGIDVTQGTLIDIMERMYESDDDIQRAELPAARKEFPVERAIDRLNRFVVETAERKVVRGGRDAHNQFLETARAFLGGDMRKVFTYTAKPEATRQDIQRHLGHIEMFRL